MNTTNNSTVVINDPKLDLKNSDFVVILLEQSCIVQLQENVISHRYFLILDKIVIVHSESNHKRLITLEYKKEKRYETFGAKKIVWFSI